jgi:hypothetical protein
MPPEVVDVLEESGHWEDGEIVNPDHKKPETD